MIYCNFCYLVLFYYSFSLLPGELPALCIETVCATNFTPLPDALCSIILQMNRRNRPATVSTIKSELESHYSHVQPPSDQVVFEALNNLMREKKLCLTGKHLQNSQSFFCVKLFSFLYQYQLLHDFIILLKLCTYFPKNWCRRRVAFQYGPIMQLFDGILTKRLMEIGTCHLAKLM